MQTRSPIAQGRRGPAAMWKHKTLRPSVAVTGQLGKLSDGSHNKAHIRHPYEEELPMTARSWGVLIVMFAVTRATGLAQQGAVSNAGDIKVTGGTIHYEESGNGPPVILLHGGQLDRRMWDGLVSELVKSYRVIRYDIRGFGQSTDPVVPYADYDDLFTLFSSLHIARASLVGLSLGGRIALDFALLHPDRVEGLILVGPGLRGFKSRDDASMNAMEWETVEAARDSGFAYATELWLKNPYMSPAMEQPQLREKIRRLALDNARNWLVNPLVERPLKPGAIERLHDVSVPTLVIVGDRDIPRMQGIADTLSRSIPRAEKRIIHGAGHIVNMEQPVEFNRAVVEFLGRTRKRGGP